MRQIFKYGVTLTASGSFLKVVKCLLLHTGNMHICLFIKRCFKSCLFSEKSNSLNSLLKILKTYSENVFFGGERS